MMPFFTLRSPQEQGVLWRQGRTGIEAELKSNHLDSLKAPFLARCIREGKPLETNRVTEDIPGYSWFQWGEAVSCCWIDNDNRVSWNNVHKPQGGENGFVVYVDEANKLGLTVGAHLPSNDWTRVQLRPDETPAVLGLPAIEMEMRRRFERP